MRGLKFPKADYWSDLAAGRVLKTLDDLKLATKERKFVVIVAILSTGQRLVAVSGSTRADMEDRLSRLLPGGYLVVTGNSAIRDSAINPQAGVRRFGFTYGGTYDCAEPKLLQGAAQLGAQVRSWTVFWYGASGKKGKNPYPDARRPLAGGALDLILPCPKCQTNEGRMMAYMRQGWMATGGPRMGSYESPI